MTESNSSNIHAGNALKKGHSPLSLIAFLGFLLMSSCTQPSLPEILPGTWEVVTVETAMPSVNPAITQEADRKEMHTIYHMEGDGHLSIEGPDIIGSYTGHWAYNAVDTTLLLSYVRAMDTLEYPLKINSWRKNYLSLTQSYNDLGHTKFVLMRTQ